MSSRHQRDSIRGRISRRLCVYNSGIVFKHFSCSVFEAEKPNAGPLLPRAQKIEVQRDSRVGNALIGQKDARLLKIR